MVANGPCAADVVSLSLQIPKPVECYNRKRRDNRFLNMDDSLIAEAMSMFCAPPASSVVAIGSASELDSGVPHCHPFGLGFDGGSV